MRNETRNEVKNLLRNEVRAETKTQLRTETLLKTKIQTGLKTKVPTPPPPTIRKDLFRFKKTPNQITQGIKLKPFKREFKYQPTARALAIGLKGKASKFGEISGLTERPRGK